jgi:hypothetical protein
MGPGEALAVDAGLEAELVGSSLSATCPNRVNQWLIAVHQGTWTI